MSRYPARARPEDALGLGGSLLGGFALVEDPGALPLVAVQVLERPLEHEWLRRSQPPGIEHAARRLDGGQDGIRREAVVAHLSGALPAGVLAGIHAAGGWQGSLHPLQSFADVETAVFYPPNLLYVVLEPTLAYALLSALHYALAAWGMRRFFVKDPNGMVINVAAHRGDAAARS